MSKKIVVLGDEKIGKTALINSILETTDVPQIQYRNRNGTGFSLWDSLLKGVEANLKFSNVKKDADHYVICVDCNNFGNHKKDISKFLNQVKQYKITTPVTLVATRLDLQPLALSTIKNNLRSFLEDQSVSAVYITSVEKNNSEFNLKLGKNTNEDQPFNNVGEVFNDIFDSVIVNRSSMSSGNTTIESNSTNRSISPNSELNNNITPDTSSANNNLQVITVGELKKLCDDYTEKSNNGVWKFFGQYGSTSMRKLSQLCKGKNDDVKLSEKKVMAYLSSRRIRALTKWIKEDANNESRALSGTEHVIREIYKTFKNAKTAQNNPQVKQ